MNGKREQVITLFVHISRCMRKRRSAAFATRHRTQQNSGAVFAVRSSLLLVHLFTTAARASCGARSTQTSRCELLLLPAEPARIAVTLRQKSSKLGRKLHFKTRLTILFIDCICLRSFLRRARATAKNCFYHLFEWGFSGPSKMLGNLRMQ